MRLLVAAAAEQAELQPLLAEVAALVEPVIQTAATPLVEVAVVMVVLVVMGTPNQGLLLVVVVELD